MKARKGGFTLVELLIVIMIIAILAGMMLLATGTATDSAEATKVINDLRNLKSAALLYYGDNMRWPGTADAASLDRYSDRPFTGTNGRYDAVTVGTGYIVDGITRINIGLGLKGNSATKGVQDKLASKAAETGLLQGADVSTIYTGGTEIFMNMR
ncbi:MAG: type II secretion system GspH family protein [Synergistaceae bacterium]|jgi:general secretion pathway protein G|nr:type II secretion system GspH family protein [Synergistaceae bacterium]